MGNAERDFYWTGDFTGRGKHVYKGGERGLHGGGKREKGKEELSRRKGGKRYKGGRKIKL